jgi:hypothetical protein
MLSLPYLFVGVLTGLLIVCVFNPAKRYELHVPTPSDTDVFHTKTGCVKINAEVIPCTGSAVSLNVIAEK